jgi:hypothetical protein
MTGGAAILLEVGDGWLIDSLPAVFGGLFDEPA